MPYPEALVAPMREELVRLGVEELKTASDVDAVLGTQTDDSTVLLVVNSVCGCAAAMARLECSKASFLCNKPVPVVMAVATSLSHPVASVMVMAG